MRTIAILGAAMLTACAAQPGQANPEPTGTQPASAQPASAEPAKAETWDGRYVVTAVNGKPPLINIAGYDPTVTIDGARVHFQSQCIYADWTLERTAAGVRSKPYYEPGSGMCARGLAPGETAIQDAFTGLTQIAPAALGGLHIAGGGHTLELRRAPLPGTLSLVGSWRVESIDGGRIQPAVLFEGDAKRLWWEPACALQMRSYMVNGSRFAAPATGTAGREVCDIGYPDSLIETWRVIEAADTIEAAGNRRIRLSGGGRSLTLVPR